MDIITLITRAFASMRRSLDGIMQDMTPALFNWAPPGTANAISATFVHLLNSEDHFLQGVLQGKPTVWESGGWSAKTGIPQPPGIGEDWSAFKRQPTAIQPLLEYKSAVWAATDAYLAELTPAELERQVPFAGGQRSAADMLMLAISQAHSHAGEIAALKGVQGAKGLPI